MVGVGFGALSLLAACEPARGIRAARDFAYEADVTCVERALQSHFPDVSRYNYVDDGYGTFPKSTSVTQFTYHRGKDGSGVSWVELGDTDEGTRVAHSFTDLGSEIPQDSFPEALLKMRAANAALASECQIDLRTAELEEIGQDVDALDR
jgi:hypothetical protein